MGSKSVVGLFYLSHRTPRTFLRFLPSFPFLTQPSGCVVIISLIIPKVCALVTMRMATLPALEVLVQVVQNIMGDACDNLYDFAFTLLLISTYQ